MARLLRFRIPGQPYHVIQRGNNRSTTFFDVEDYKFYRTCLKDACVRYGASIHAYALMSNHVHLLLTPRGATSIEKVMHSVGGRYAQRMNRKCDRTGPFWDGRYRSTLVDSDRYLLTCYRYIELNPVRAGIVAHPASYEWSSHRRHAFGQADDLIRDHAIYRLMGDTPIACQRAYRALFGSEIDTGTLRLIQSSTNNGWALGTEEFRSRFAAETHRRGSPLRLRATRVASVGLAPTNLQVG